MLHILKKCKELLFLRAITVVNEAYKVVMGYKECIHMLQPRIIFMQKEGD